MIIMKITKNTKDNKDNGKYKLLRPVERLSIDRSPKKLTSCE